MSCVQDRIDGSTRRIDGILDNMARREAERQRAEDSARMRAEREQARADSERCREYQVRYDDAFRGFGVQTPPPVEGERPGRYRQRLYEGLRRKLPSDHELFATRADDIPSSAARNFESMLLTAAMGEALRPSPENLPRDGSLIRRERTDEHGARSVEWLGRRSFIADMGRPSGRVLRFVDRKNGNAVVWGMPFSRPG
jgi:hypothetical protein